jgi:rSAM/selenodomain-associated transferase 1
MASLGNFAKPPIPGKVKTRLIKDIGRSKATKIYRHCLEYSIQTARNSGLEYLLHLTEASSDPIFAEAKIWLQQGHDLGDRMHAAIEHQLDEYKQAAMIIGSDCIELKQSHLHDASNALETHDLVLVPSVDGGFALIGCRRFDPRLFNDITWSTDQVLSQTLANAEELNFSHCLLETVRDVDTLHDLQHFPELLELLAHK